MELEISVLTAMALIVCNAAGFVFSIYLVPASRKEYTSITTSYTDNDTVSMLHRILVVLASCVLFTVFLYAISNKTIGPSFVEWVYADIGMGCVWSVLFALAVNTVLFAVEITAVYLGYVAKTPFAFTLKFMKDYLIVLLNVTAGATIGGVRVQGAQPKNSDFRRSQRLLGCAGGSFGFQRVAPSLSLRREKQRPLQGVPQRSP